MSAATNGNVDLTRQPVNLPGWGALAIMKAGPLRRGVSIALSDTLTCMAAPSWGSPTATFLREGLRSRGPASAHFHASGLV